MMNEVIASLPEFVAPDREIIRRVPVYDAVSARRHSHLSSNAANYADDSDPSGRGRRGPYELAVLEPFGQHADTPSCQISLINSARRPRRAYTAPSNGVSDRRCTGHRMISVRPAVPCPR